jgi:hypothetical protein
MEIMNGFRINETVSGLGLIIHGIIVTVSEIVGFPDTVMVSGNIGILRNAFPN